MDTRALSGLARSCVRPLRRSAGLTERANRRYLIAVRTWRQVMAGIPFIGEEGFYPDWAKWSGIWVFQRTLVSVGGFMPGYAELAAARLSVSDQVIVWVPRKRSLF